MYIDAMLYVVLAVMCISVIYSVSSWVWDFDLQQDLGKPSREQPNQAIGVGNYPNRPRSRGGKMWFSLLGDSGKDRLIRCSATMHSRSSMYKLSAICYKSNKDNLTRGHCRWLCKWLTLFFLSAG